MPSTGEDHASALARARRGALPSLASEGNRRTDSSMLLERRLDLSPPAFACEIEAACAPAASAGVCFHEHDCGPLEHPNHRIAVGATARFLPSYPGRGQSPKGLEVRGRGKPLLDALRGDCSSRRLCPNPDRFERLLSRPSFSRPVRSDAGREGDRHRVASMQGSQATGPCDAELPRRNPTFTNPRHLPSRGRSRTNEGSCRSASRATVCRRLFHCRGSRAGDARVDPGSSADRMRRLASQPLVDPPQRPS